MPRAEIRPEDSDEKGRPYLATQLTKRLLASKIEPQIAKRPPFRGSTDDTRSGAAVTRPDRPRGPLGLAVLCGFDMGLEPMGKATGGTGQSAYETLGTRMNTKTLLAATVVSCAALLSVSARADDSGACAHMASKGKSMRDARQLIEAEAMLRVCAQEACPPPFERTALRASRPSTSFCRPWY